MVVVQSPDFVFLAETPNNLHPKTEVRLVIFVSVAYEAEHLYVSRAYLKEHWKMTYKKKNCTFGVAQAILLTRSRCKTRSWEFVFLSDPQIKG